MICRKCAYDNDKKNKYCAGCGALLEEAPESPRVNPDDIVRCPFCGSSNVHFVTIQESQSFDKSDACCGYLLCGPLGLLCGVKDSKPPKTVRKCMNCQREF